MWSLCLHSQRPLSQQVKSQVGVDGFSWLNMMFMHAPNNVISTAATALFDECLFPKCAKHKVPPVTQIQELEEPKISIETESVPDDNNSDAPFAPPHDSIILQGDEERSHDDAEPQCLPQLLPRQPRHAPGGAQHGNEPPQCSEREMKGTRTYTHPAPLQTPTDVENCLMQTAQHLFLIQDS